MSNTTFVRLTRSEKQTIQELLDYLNSHYAEKLTTDSLAEQFCFPVKKMQAAVQAFTGRSLHAYILTLRLEAAKSLILEDEPLKTVAGAIGFKRPSQFGVFFKRHTGQTPCEFRNSQCAT